MAATFAKETAVIEEVYVRQVMAGGKEKYIRLPFNLVTYDDGQQYIEPVSCNQGIYTWNDINTPATDGKFRIEDVAPAQGVTEIR